MARLRRAPGRLDRSDDDSDDSSLPELHEIIQRSRVATAKTLDTSTKASTVRYPDLSAKLNSSREASDSVLTNSSSETLSQKDRSEEPSATKRKQRVLKPLKGSESLLVKAVPLAQFPERSRYSKARVGGVAKIKGLEEPEEKKYDNKENTRSEERRTVEKRISKPVQDVIKVEIDVEEAEIMETSWCGSEEEAAAAVESTESEDSDDSDIIVPRRNAQPGAGARRRRKSSIDESFVEPSEAIRPSSSSSTNEEGILRFNPTYLSPRKAIITKRPSTPERPVTPPPQSPSKSRLVSPSKSRKRIPTPPHIRPSIDAFWQPEVVNDWNDQYSPKKTLSSPKKLLPLDLLPDKPTAITLSDDEDFALPPGKSSPKKKGPSPIKQQRDARKAFEARKDDMATSFLRELDDTITKGKLAAMTESTGGIRIVWTNKLNSTAGRANWRREAIRIKQRANPSLPPSQQQTSTSTAVPTTTTYKHHATIELASKVISDDTRLLNVLAHEFCHLANFMVSNVRNNPHGREFKAWASQVTARFGGSHGIQVTTKHSYDIEYKYVWQCAACGMEFKRHSKSIDVRRHTCGACRGQLVQTKPKPRAEEGKVSEYQAFVKANYGGVKKELVGKGQAAVMERLGQLYREEKERRGREKEVEKNSLKLGLVDELEMLTLDD